MLENPRIEGADEPIGMFGTGKAEAAGGRGIALDLKASQRQLQSGARRNETQVQAVETNLTLDGFGGGRGIKGLRVEC